MTDLKYRSDDARSALRTVSLQLAEAVGVPSNEAASNIDHCLAGSAPQQRHANHYEENVEWPEPIELLDTVQLSTFPLECLPRWLSEWVESTSLAKKTSPDVAAMLSLAVLAACCARCFRVQVDDEWFENPNAYVCVVLPPASRKSAVFSAATAPLHEYERVCGEKMRVVEAKAQARLRVAEQRMRITEDVAARAKVVERAKAEADLERAAEELLRAKAAVQCVPRLICSDATQEQLVKMLAANGGSIALMDAEGCGPIANMLGRYSPNQAPQLEIFLKAHVGDPVRVDRVSRESVVIDRPRLTIALTTQPAVLEKFRSEPQLRGLGLHGRFWWCIPKCNIGSRKPGPSPVPEVVLREYARAIRDLLQRKSEPLSIIAVSPEARAVLLAFEENLEPRLGTGGDLAHFTEWAGKLSGSIARIAALLHAADFLSEPSFPPVPASTMCRAIKIGEFLLAHAQEALTQVGVDPAVTDAVHVLAWLRRNKIGEFTRRDLFNAQRSRFAKAEKVDPALAVLKKHHWIAEVGRTAAPVKPGRKPSPLYRVHPSANKPQNPQNDT